MIPLHSPSLQLHPWIRPAVSLSCTDYNLSERFGVTAPSCPSSQNGTRSNKGMGRCLGAAARCQSVLIFPSFLPAAPQRVHPPLLFAGPQVEGVNLQLLHNIFLSRPALTAAQPIRKGLALLNL